MVKYKSPKNVLRNSVILGLTMLAIDFLAHNTIGNPETLYYYIAKPIIAGYFAFIMLQPQLNIQKRLNFLNLKSKTNLYYIYWATLFALVHGIYYRFIDFFQGMELFSRVGVVQFGGLTFNTLPEMIFVWAIIHSGSFLIGLMVIKFMGRK